MSWLILVLAISLLAAPAPSAFALPQTCKCYEPIRADATAEGACTITQNDGDHCNITFRVEQTAIALRDDPAFRVAAAALT
jgi:hypothetical protein